MSDWYRNITMTGINNLVDSISRRFFFSHKRAENIQDVIVDTTPRFALRRKSGWKPNEQLLTSINPNFHERVTEFQDKAKSLVNSSFLMNAKASKNVARMEMKELNDLLYNDHLTVLPCDKNMGYAIARSDWVNQQTFKHLLSENYKEIDYSNAHTLLKNACSTMRACLKPFLEHGRVGPKWQRQTSLFILSFTDRYKPEVRNSPLPTSPMKILAKVHKDPVDSRPVIAAFNTITTGISVLLTKFLRPYVECTPRYLKNTTHLLVDLGKIRVKPEDEVVILTADVSNLYGNTDINNLKLVLTEMYNDMEKNKHPMPYSADIMTKLTSTLLHTNTVEFKSRYFVQTDGIAMGTNVGPALANLYMNSLENRLKFELTTLLYWKRYIDDVIMIFAGKHSLRDCQIAMTRYNSTDPKIKLTQVLAHSHGPYDSPKVPFLDVNVFRKNERIEYSPYTKETNLFLHIPRNSYHPPHTMSGWVSAELSRLARNSSNASYYYEARKDFYVHLKERGYDSKFLNVVFLSKNYECRDMIFNKFNSPASADELDKIIHQGNKKIFNDDDPFFIVLPYIPHLAHTNWSGDLTTLAVEHELHKYMPNDDIKIRTAWKASHGVGAQVSKAFKSKHLSSSNPNPLHTDIDTNTMTTTNIITNTL